MKNKLLASLFAGLFANPALGNDQLGNAYQFSFPGIDGGELKLSDYAGKVLLVVNTASKCGFTKQYTGLEELYDKFKDRGLIVLGVPSNDFGGQEPGTEAEIKEFCDLTFNVSFPMTAKTVVSGDSAHPFYQWAGQQVGFIGRPKWNFHKYLIDGNGKLVSWFATTTKPMDGSLVSAIDHLLPQKP